MTKKESIAVGFVVILFLAVALGGLFLLHKEGENECRAYAASHGYEFAFFDSKSECWGSKNGVNMRLYQPVEKKE